MAASQAPTVLGDSIYDDPSQLSQALDQRAGSQQALQFTPSPRSHHAESQQTLHFAPSPASHHAATPALTPAHASALPSSRRTAPTRYAKPSLPTHNSAPTTTGFLADREGALKMNRTFHGVDTPGDTQPDSQMHKQWMSGAFSSALDTEHHVLPPKSLFVEHSDEEEEEDDDDDDDCDDNSMPRNDAELVKSSQAHHSANIASPTIMDVDEQGELAQDSLAQTSPLKFETPTLAARKATGSTQQLLSSATRTIPTPGTVASASAFGTAFGNVAFTGGPAMSLTQIWNNTQAPTSPAVGELGEDVAFTRPSPNFTNARHSSPGPAYSSPIKDLCPNTPASEPRLRSSSEPRAEYVTMKQSQEKRRGSNGEAIPLVAPQDNWETLSRKMQQRMARTQFHQQAARSPSQMSAPPVLASRPRKSKGSAHYPSPDRPRVSHNVNDGGPSEAEADSVGELSRSKQVKSYNSESPYRERGTARATTNRNSNENSVQVPKTSSHPHRTPTGLVAHDSSQQASPSSQLQRESQLQGRIPQGSPRFQCTMDSIAIMDSQPDVLADFDSIPPPKALRYPSSPSQNRYSIHQTTMGAKSGYTSQVVSSSMPPMPPKLSQDGLADTAETAVTPEHGRVPSSPPVLSNDQNIEYDEHTYDEYTEGCLDSEPDEPVSEDGVDHDVVMEDEELPLIQDEQANTIKVHLEEETDDEDMGLIESQKADLETGQEVHETLEEHPIQADCFNEDQLNHKEPREIPRLKRQDTVPETDALDGTQPLVSTSDADAKGEQCENGVALSKHTNSTDPFKTIQDKQPGSEFNQQDHGSLREAGSLAMETSHRIQSIDDIYNLPETQHSLGEDELEFPRLSGIEEEETTKFASLPASPSAKRRKTTYKTKRSVFRSPVKPERSVHHDQPEASFPDTRPPPLSIDSPPMASAQMLEDRGADTAAKARNEVQFSCSKPPTLKSKTLPRSLKLQTHRKGALKPVPKGLLGSLASPDSPGLESGASVVKRASTPVTPTRPRKVLNKQENVARPDVDNQADELNKATSPAVPLEKLLEKMSQLSAMPLGEVLVPNRVFASWPGSHYYPATCIGRIALRQFRIRYDDGNITSMDAVHVRSFDLRAGDHVKVDEPGMKKNTYVVVGFKDKVDCFGDEQFPSTDRYGHATVVIEEKRRDSTPALQASKQPHHISVPMASIYLTTALWSRLRDRCFTFSPPASPAKSASHVGTPVLGLLTTPSFTRRGTAVPSFLKSATTRAASVASTNRSGSAVFANMAFVLTSTADDFSKDALAKTIKSNGGMVLEHGFHELFDYEVANVPASPGRQSSSFSHVGSNELTLKPLYKDIGFVALISDSYSRSTKYIQALALNVPCLHLRWIQDSLAAARAVLFPKYLLPAGLSKFLDAQGVVRSRTIQSYDPAAEDLFFADILHNRPLLLRDQTVLLVTGKSKKEIEKRQPFVFLTHALGSAHVNRCADLAEASEMLADGHWDWVYVDSNDMGVLGVAAELFGTSAPVPSSVAAAGGETKTKKGGRKRKREDGSEEKEDLVARVTVGGKRIRVTCSEFVIQSLILGALLEE